MEQTIPKRYFNSQSQSLKSQLKKPKAQLRHKQKKLQCTLRRKMTQKTCWKSTLCSHTGKWSQKSEITVLKSRKTVHQPSIVKSLVTNVLLRAKKKASVQSTGEKGKPYTIFDKNNDFWGEEAPDFVLLCCMHEEHWQCPKRMVI